MSNQKGKILRFQPTLKQDIAWEYLLDNETEELLFGGGAGGGKTWIGWEWLIYLANRYPDTSYFVARKTLKNLKKTTLRSFFKVCKFHGLKKDIHYKYQEQQSTITFPNGSWIDLVEVDFKPSDPEYEDLGSSEYTSGWIEEAGEVNFGAYDTLATRIGRRRNDEFNILAKLFITCNPSKNWLYRLFYKPFKAGTLSKRQKFLQSLIDDNPKNEKGYKNKLFNIKNQAKKQRLLYGNWEYDDDPSALMEYDAIVDLFTNTIEYDENDKWMTVDVARFGDDKTVLKCWQGLKVYKIIVREKQDTDATADLIDKVSKEDKIPRSHIIIDEDGIGGGVVDKLKGVKGFVANSSALEDKRVNIKQEERPNYRNLKAQCSYMLAEEVNSRRMLIDTKKVDWDSEQDIEEYIIEELEQIKERSVDDDSKRLEVLPKEKVKEAIGRSPDFADCLVMRMLGFLAREKQTGFKQHKPLRAGFAHKFR
ncbi:MAG TPA: phage terminase large subunit [Candidatus Dojkabacteria bacterium]